MAASTGLVLGHNDELTDPNPMVYHRIFSSDDDLRYLVAGYNLVGYAQAVEQHTYIQALSDWNYARLGPVSPPSVERSVVAFIRGWRAAGGVEEWLDFVVNTMIPCESSWDPNVTSPNGLYRGLGQWDWPTWNGIATLTGYSDIWNPFDQGFNVAFKSRRDGGFAWPECWEARWN